MEGLADEPRPGRPPTISVEQVEDVVVTTLEQLPKNATHRSRTSMARHSGLSKSTVGRPRRAGGDPFAHLYSRPEAPFPSR
ncbi:hypothetical protein [Streptomyces sp. NPDC002855]|uniref:hypothetical protein n=1 Tax=unclassified Streptomyces TaxID=2593676 RepID=UPI00331D2050